MKRAMVVDDDDSVLPIAARWLREEGYAVSTANCFDAGLAAVRTECPDILVVDVRLGGFNGLHLAIVARELRSDVRVVLISGWDDPVLRHEARSCGAAYLCKPLTRRQLLTQTAASA
jgi:DNA-binding response OmpR family regulator